MADSDVKIRHYLKVEIPKRRINLKKQTNIRKIVSLVLLTIALLFITNIQTFTQKKNYSPGVQNNKETKLAVVGEADQEILFTSHRDGNQEIYSMNVNGSEMKLHMKQMRRCLILLIQLHHT